MREMKTHVTLSRIACKSASSAMGRASIPDVRRRAPPVYQSPFIKRYPVLINMCLGHVPPQRVRYNTEFVRDQDAARCRRKRARLHRWR